MTTQAETLTSSQLLASYLRYVMRGLIRQGYSSTEAQAAVAPGTARHLDGQSLMGAARLILANQRRLQDAQMPDTAEGEDLDRLSGIHGLERNPGSGAAGKVVITATGLVSLVAGAELTSNTTSVRYQTIGPGIYNSGDSVDVVGVDIGTASNLDAGELVTWTSPPPNLAAESTVDANGLTGGTDLETDAELRVRLLDRLRYPQAGGNWSHYRAWALEASGGVQEAYVYPALQGPCTVRISLTGEGNADNNYSRTVSNTLLNLVENHVVGQSPEFADIQVNSAAHEDLGVAFIVQLNEPISAGGLGGGWIEAPNARFPDSLSGAPVTITAATSATQVTVNATTPTPLPGQQVSFWATSEGKLYTTEITAVSGVSGAWVLTLGTSLPTLIASDYVFPAAEHTDDYAATFRAQVANLAPGERTADLAVLPRAYRHPTTIDGKPSSLTSKELCAIQAGHSDIISIRYSAINGVTAFTLPLEPTVPANATDDPNVWRVNHIGFYYQ